MNGSIEYLLPIIIHGLKRPPNLVRAELRLREAGHSAEVDATNLTNQLQELLDHVCSKADFVSNASDRTGYRVPGLPNLMAGKCEVWLYSKGDPREPWIAASFVPAGPFQPGNPFL